MTDNRTNQSLLFLNDPVSPTYQQHYIPAAQITQPSVTSTPSPDLQVPPCSVQMPHQPFFSDLRRMIASECSSTSLIPSSLFQTMIPSWQQDVSSREMSILARYVTSLAIFVVFYWLQFYFSQLMGCWPRNPTDVNNHWIFLNICISRFHLQISPSGIKCWTSGQGVIQSVPSSLCKHRDRASPDAVFRCYSRLQGLAQQSVWPTETPGMKIKKISHPLPA